MAVKTISTSKKYDGSKEVYPVFFDYVEDLIEDKTLLKMDDFAASIDEFLKFRRFKILSDKGNISKINAERKAHLEYDAYNKTQKIDSDFEKEIAKVKEGLKRGQ